MRHSSSDLQPVALTCSVKRDPIFFWLKPKETNNPPPGILPLRLKYSLAVRLNQNAAGDRPDSGNTMGSNEPALMPPPLGVGFGGGGGCPERVDAEM